MMSQDIDGHVCSLVMGGVSSEMLKKPPLQR